MKKILSIAAVVAFVFSMSSCRKDYECVCTDSNGTVTAEFKNVTKSEAELACSGDGCELK